MRPLAVAAALFLLAACSRAGPQPRPQGDAAPPASQTGGFDGQRAWNDLLRLVSFGPRPPGSENLKRARAYIVSQLEAAGCAVEVQLFHAQTPIGTLPMANVIARSGKPDGGLILLLTHYDTLRLENFVGADDGASSSAVMLELARQLCRASLPTAVWIAFLDGEEAQVQWSDTDSLYGSRELAARLALSGDLRRVRAVLLADMVGDRDLDILREENSTPWLTDLVWSVARRLGYGRYFLDRSQAVEDDHLPFLRRGVAAVDLIDFDYPYWHTPADTPDKCSARSLAIVGHVLLETVRELARRPS
jgi:predicted small lipoprotein YifL